MPEILIHVRDKLPQIVGDVRQIVADNTDYTIRFTFDDLWEDGAKTVYFVRSNGYAFAPAETSGDTVTVPKQVDVKTTSRLLIGVQQGDVKTSKPCSIVLMPAITDHIDDDSVQPAESMWEDLLSRLEYLEKFGTGGAGGMAYEIGAGLTLDKSTNTLSADITEDSFTEIPNTKVQEIFNKVMAEA